MDSSATAKKQQLLQRYANGDRYFGEIDLYQEDLTAVDLMGSEFPKANLWGANLIRANLRNVDFRQANLSQANLHLADLRGANLTGANLRRSNLAGAKLQGAILDGASFTGATMPDGALFAGHSTLIAQEEKAPLTPDEIKQDLKKVERPKPALKQIEPLHRSRDQLIRDLPRIPLLCLGTGLFLFSLQGAMLGINPIGYLFLMLGVWGCTKRSDFAWFLPAIGGISIFGSGGVSIVVVFGFLIFIALTVATIMGGQALEGSSKGALWLSALATIFMLIYGVAIGNIEGYHPGVILGAMLLTGLGAVSAEDLRTKRYERSQMTVVLLSVAGLGISLGIAIGLLFSMFSVSS